MKKIVTVVIIAALVLAAFIALAGNVKADSTSEVSIVSYSRYVAPSNPTFGGPQGVQPGDLIVVGEVKNIGASVITNVTLQGIALDDNGQTLATSSTQAFVYYMLPGQKAPFYLDFGASSSSTQDLSWVASVNSVTVTATTVVDSTNSRARQYTGISLVSNVNYTDDSGIYIVRGTIENTGNQIAVQPWVVTTFYNAAGTVISMNFTNYLISSLSPTGAYLFFATPVDNNTALTSQIKDYTCQIDTLTLASTSSTPTPTSTSTASTAPTNQFPTLIIALIFVVLVIVVIAALMLVKRGKKLPLPPPPPTE